MSNLPSDYDKEQTSPLALLKARWSAEQASGNARRFTPFTQECISMATLVCAHGTAILTNRGPSELVPSEARSLLGLESRSMASGRISRMHLNFLSFSDLGHVSSRLSQKSWAPSR